MSDEQDAELETITEQSFMHDLRLIKSNYLEQVTENTKLYHNCDDIARHINFLHSNNYSVVFYRTGDGEITYEFKEREIIGFKLRK